jgi:hypothetical protein
MPNSRSLVFRLVLFAGYLVTFFWLNSLTVIGSEAWEAHLQNLPAALDLPVHASPWMCLLAGVLTIFKRIPLRYASGLLALFVLLGFAILHFWYVPYDFDQKQVHDALPRGVRHR